MTPFNSGVASVTALAGGHVDAMSVAVSDAVVAIHGGSVRPLAVSGDTRSKQLPDVPAFIEAGFPDLTPYGWVALLAPAKTDKAVLKKLNEAVNGCSAIPRRNARSRMRDSKRTSARARGPGLSCSATCRSGSGF